MLTIGQTVKISRTKTLAKPLFFGYSFTDDPDYAYCQSTRLSFLLCDRTNTL